MRRGRASLVLLAALLAAPPLAGAQRDAPLAYFTLDQAKVGTGEKVLADASESIASSGARIAEYAWRWDEGAAYVAGNLTEPHAYSQGGLHVVGLRVTDSAGRVAFVNQTLLVIGARPEANFIIARQEPQNGGLLIVVNATFSQPSRGATRIVSYEWDWGEPGGPGFVPGNVTETHVFAVASAYDVRLRVTDDQGRNDTFLEPVVVKSTFLTRLLEVWGIRDAFLRGATFTVELAVVTTILGFVLAVVLALMRVSRWRILRWPAAAYIEVIRGTPLLVQILIAWLVLPFVGLKLPILIAGGLALTVNTSAYQAEAMRAGIQAIPTGQMEASISLGMTYLQAMRHIIVPQAFRLAIPPLGNEFVTLLKDTSLVSVIGVVELTQVARIFSAQTFIVLEAFLGVALIYFVMTYSITTALRYLERRLAIPGLGLGAAP